MDQSPKKNHAKEENRKDRSPNKKTTYKKKIKRTKVQKIYIVESAKCKMGSPRNGSG